MSKGQVADSYAQSVLWIALFMAVMCGVMNVVELLFIDFVHGNPHRTQEDAISMMAHATPIFGVVTIAVSIMVFAIPQFFQAALIGVLHQPFGSQARFMALLALPLTAALTWYCYDYLTPSFLNLGNNGDQDWTPSEQGLTLSHYMTALAFQTPITLFSFLYFDAGFRRNSRIPVLIVALAASIIIGGILGYVRAEHQFQFM